LSSGTDVDALVWSSLAKLQVQMVASPLLSQRRPIEWVLSPDE
jgi:hypothetical protein